MTEVSSPWPKPSGRPEEERTRYVFIGYSKSFSSDEVINLGKLFEKEFWRQIFKKETWRQIFFRFASNQSDFRHAAIVVLTYDDFNNERPNGNEWHGVFWDWGRRRIRGTREIHPSGEAQITGPKVWDQAEAASEALRFCGITVMSDEKITARMQNFMDANRIYNVNRNNCETFCEHMSSDITWKDDIDYELAYIDSRVNALFRQTGLKNYTGVIWSLRSEAFRARLLRSQTKLGGDRLLLILICLLHTLIALYWRNYGRALFFPVLPVVVRYLFPSQIGGSEILCQSQRDEKDRISKSNDQDESHEPTGLMWYVFVLQALVMGHDRLAKAEYMSLLVSSVITHIYFSMYSVSFIGVLALVGIFILITFLLLRMQKNEELEFSVPWMMTVAVNGPGLKTLLEFVEKHELVF